MIICDTKKVDANGKYRGVPTLVAEVLSGSTRKKDMQKKLNLYTETGIREYWIVDPDKKGIYLYTFEDQNIRDIRGFSGDTAVKSIYFSGLELMLQDIFSD